MRQKELLLRHIKSEWILLSLEGLWRQLGSWHVDGAERHGAAEEVLEWRRHLFAFPARERRWNEIMQKSYTNTLKYNMSPTFYIAKPLLIQCHMRLCDVVPRPEIQVKIKLLLLLPCPKRLWPNLGFINCQVSSTKQRIEGRIFTKKNQSNSQV